MLEDLARQAVEREEVSDFTVSSVHAERVNHFLPRHQEVTHLILVKVDSHLCGALEVVVEQFSDFRNISIRHRSHFRDGNWVEFLELDVTSHSLIGRPRREADIDQLLWV